MAHIAHASLAVGENGIHIMVRRSQIHRLACRTHIVPSVEYDFVDGEVICRPPKKMLHDTFDVSIEDIGCNIEDRAERVRPLIEDLVSGDTGSS